VPIYKLRRWAMFIKDNCGFLALNEMKKYTRKPNAQKPKPGTSIVADRDSDAIYREFWAEWERLYRAGNETEMERHVSKLLACKMPDRPITPSIMASVLNTYFMDLAKHIKEVK